MWTIFDWTSAAKNFFNMLVLQNKVPLIVVVVKDLVTRWGSG